MSILSGLSQLKLSHKGLILVAVPLIFEIVFVVWLGILLDQTEREVQREQHSREVVGTTNQLVKNILFVASISSSNSEGLMAPRSDDGRLFRQNLVEIPQNLKRLKELVKDRPAQSALVIQIEGNTRSAFSNIDKFQDDMQRGQIDFSNYHDKLKELKNKIQPDVTRIGANLMEMMDQEKKLEQAFPAKQQRIRNQTKMLLASAVLFNVLIAVWLALYFNRGTAQKLNVLVDNTGRLARREELNPPLEGSDEISQLDRVFREMAVALAAAARKERAIVNNAVDVICSIYATGKFTAMNPASQNVLGYDAGELIGTNIIDLTVEDDVPATLQALELAMTGETLSFENRVRKKDGFVVDILWSVHWAPEENSLFCVAHDITERKQIERMKREFVAMVSHDLRTPLTSIQGFLSLVNVGMYGQLNESGQESCSIAEGNINRLIALINDLLDIEKMESGKLELTMDGVTVRSIFERTHGAVAGFADQQGIKLKVVDSDLELEADGDRLVQVLINLVSNAVKFSPKGSAVTMSASSPDKGETIEFKVIDHGRGIPESYRETIFDRFQQVEANDAKKKGGSGLGLAICKAIVERHGGTIGVDSQEGSGSTFWFRIPADPDDGSDEPGDDPHSQVVEINRTERTSA